MSTVIYTRKALRQIKKFPESVAIEILESIDMLKDFPDVRHVAHLKGHEYDYRLKIGRYRAMFTVSETESGLEILIHEVKIRNDHTY